MIVDYKKTILELCLTMCDLKNAIKRKYCKKMVIKEV